MGRGAGGEWSSPVVVVVGNDSSSSLVVVVAVLGNDYSSSPVVVVVGDDAAYCPGGVGGRLERVLFRGPIIRARSNPFIYNVSEGG